MKAFALEEVTGAQAVANLLRCLMYWACRQPRSMHRTWDSKKRHFLVTMEFGEREERILISAIVSSNI